MVTMQKFKFLATQCSTIAQSPSRSPTTSPVIHIRNHRRKTLRMLLNRAKTTKDQRTTTKVVVGVDQPVNLSRKLKDFLLVSSPPLDGNDTVKGDELIIPRRMERSGARVGLRRPFMGSLRYRLLRRAWRPVLVTIPE
ncbi:hypothetical protein GIB67_037479 [Kingdonia uniflora]|uniref:Uncharacterized protein n=1 Tax=Kingdonia uniflora TaxID=39325 RepID=A0A7J7KXC7_9MAGN|nr:hypothetical protein GIB67_037479 [Kingdonia uniflora]